MSVIHTLLHTTALVRKDRQMASPSDLQEDDTELVGGSCRKYLSSPLDSEDQAE